MGKENCKASQPDKKIYLKQSDVPAASLEEALRIPQSIFDNYVGKSATPLQVAKALNIDPKGSQLKLLSGASIAFGLIDGGAQASIITVTELAKRIIRPQEENQDLYAKREAVLTPRIFEGFLRKYDGSPFPRNDIAINVLEEMGVPRNKVKEVLERLDASARSVGFIEVIKDKSYISLQTNQNIQASNETDFNDNQEENIVTEKTEETSRNIAPPPAIQPMGASLHAAIADDQRRRRVFITHGKNHSLLEPIKKLLEYGELEPVVSVEKTSVSKPVPEKVMNEMRNCGAGIIHVDIDQNIEDKDGNFHVILNPNVMIEIGAAMAFYGKRFILLVRDGIQLPSNLQGLFEVRYTNDNLDAESTIKLLEAIKDIKNYDLPSSGTDFETWFYGNTMDHPMTPTLQTELDTLKEIILRTVPVEQIWLFGSYAYGTPHKDSDIDLYVVLKDDVQMRLIDAAITIRIAIGRKKTMPVDVVTSTLGKYRERSKFPTLERTISHKGIKIYG